MNAIVFSGPSLTKDDIAPYHRFEFRPPVRQGELYAAARERPKAIGIIDGYFDGQPAVLHKEILWALTQGIAVFGAASMGALRAAELHTFGMRGIGRIFEAYRDGELTDDDEVALIHGPPEMGYVRLSEPMTNIRATLEKAVAEKVIDATTAARVSASVKARFYQQRTWSEVLASVGDPRQFDRLSAWLRTGKVDIKREDGRELLKQMDEFIRADVFQAPPNFHFEWTEIWHNAPWRTYAPSNEKKATPDEEAILDDLRLRGNYPQLRRDALLRLLAGREHDAAPDRQAIKRAADDFRLPRRLMQQANVTAWAQQNGTNLAGFERLVENNARIETLARLHDAELRQGILDRLRELDLYTVHQEGAMGRQRRPELPSAPIPRALLAAWYFEKQLGLDVPADLAEYAASIGLSSVDRFFELLAGEYAFLIKHTWSQHAGEADENSLA